MPTEIELLEAAMRAGRPFSAPHHLQDGLAYPTRVVCGAVGVVSALAASPDADGLEVGCEECLNGPKLVCNGPTDAWHTSVIIRPCGGPCPRCQRLVV